MKLYEYYESTRGASTTQLIANAKAEASLFEGGEWELEYIHEYFGEVVDERGRIVDEEAKVVLRQKR